MSTPAIADLNYRSLSGGGDTVIDEVSATVTYIAESQSPGDAASGATWRIKKIDRSVNPTTIKWANGTSFFDKVYDDRTTYTY